MKNLFYSTLFVSILLVGCLDDPQSPPEENVAVGTVIAEFVDAETTQPLEGEPFSVSLFFDSVGDYLFVDGIRETDENGLLEIQLQIQSDQQEMVSAINFGYEGTNLDIDEITEDIDLELRFEEPFDEAEVFIEIDTDNQ